MGQSGFMVKKRNLPPLLSFSALLVCILLHCRLTDWCGNMRKASGHVVCHLDHLVSFRIFDSTFYFPYSAIPHFTHSLSENWVSANREDTGKKREIMWEVSRFLPGYDEIE